MRRSRNRPRPGGGSVLTDKEIRAQIAVWLCRILLHIDMPLAEFEERFSWPLLHNTLSIIGYGRLRGEVADVGRETARRRIRKCLAENEVDPRRRDGAIVKNVRLFGQTLGLRPVEEEILLFALLRGVSGTLQGVTDQVVLHSNIVSFGDFLGAVLGLNGSEVREALSRTSTLVSTGILKDPLRNDGNGKTVLELIQGIGPVFSQEHGTSESIMAAFFRRAPESKLAADDFPHLHEDSATLFAFLREARARNAAGVNVLLHGPPGTGKTELARLSARMTGLELFEVPVDDNGDPGVPGKRLSSYLICQRLLARNPFSLILFDECEDVFPVEEHTFLGLVRKSGRDKGFTNRLLERNPVPAIWCTNAVGQMDRAFLRRFAFQLAVKVPPRRVRARILSHYLDGLPVSREWIERVSQSDALSPADIENGAQVARMLGATCPSHVESAVERVLRNRLETRGKRLVTRQSPSATDGYSIDFINANCDLAALVESLQERPVGTVCLYGSPGTGKTAFVRHAADAIGRPLLVKRASDVLSMWVGGTERNIADMFSEAQAEGAVLLLDEADSFLQDRRGAHQSWEVTQVNEMLTQMEEFEGLFICSTNLIDGLDPAAFRRFAVKISFGYMTPVQSTQMFMAELMRHGVPFDDGSDECRAIRSRLGRVQNLTPGDFATVRKKLRMLKITLTPAALLNLLEQECAAKREDFRKAVGF